MNLRLSLVALCLLAAACGSKSTLPPDPIVDAGQQEVPDAGPPSPCEQSGECKIVWKDSPDYPLDVDHHSTFIATSKAGTFLYAAGGVRNQDQKVHDAVYRAPINEKDGTLGAWIEGTKLLAPFGYHGFAQSGKYVYLMAGISEDKDGAYAHDATLIGTIGDDGDITWKQSASHLKVAFLHGTGAVLGKTLYMFGGTGGMAPQSVVKVATIADDGTISAWSDGPSLPKQRSHHVAMVKDGYLWVMGGFDVSQYPLPEILRSEHDANGTLTGWTKVGEMESASWTSAGAIYKDHLFMIGGGEGGPGDQHFVNRVRRARFYENMTVSPFEDAGELPEARAHVHQVPMFGHRIYSVGGRHTDELLTFAKVFIGEVVDAPAK